MAGPSAKHARYSHHLTSEPNVALRPIPTDQEQKLKDEALLREVDDAYREEQLDDRQILHCCRRRLRRSEE
ncbi:MAG TPA: hypothetical protein VL100_14080, partial [Croceibacterium sp.]|nr:hypothetical protein [Croceibacterium sp.]